MSILVRALVKALFPPGRLIFGQKPLKALTQFKWILVAGLVPSYGLLWYRDKYHPHRARILPQVYDEFRHYKLSPHEYQRISQIVELNLLAQQIVSRFVEQYRASHSEAAAA